MVTEIRFAEGARIAYPKSLGYAMQDERAVESTARQAHEWASAHNLYIRCPFWGIGQVVDHDGNIVVEEVLPDFVKEHLKFRFPEFEEGDEPAS